MAKELQSVAKSLGVRIVEQVPASVTVSTRKTSSTSTSSSSAAQETSSTGQRVQKAPRKKSDEDHGKKTLQVKREHWRQVLTGQEEEGSSKKISKEAVGEKNKFWSEVSSEEQKKDDVSKRSQEGIRTQKEFWKSNKEQVERKQEAVTIPDHEQVAEKQKFWSKVSDKEESKEKALEPAEKMVEEKQQFWTDVCAKEGREQEKGPKTEVAKPSTGALTTEREFWEAEAEAERKRIGGQKAKPKSQETAIGTQYVEDKQEFWVKAAEEDKRTPVKDVGKIKTKTLTAEKEFWEKGKGDKEVVGKKLKAEDVGDDYVTQKHDFWNKVSEEAMQKVRGKRGSVMSAEDRARAVAAAKEKEQRWERQAEAEERQRKEKTKTKKIASEVEQGGTVSAKQQFWSEEAKNREGEAGKKHRGLVAAAETAAEYVEAKQEFWSNVSKRGETHEKKEAERPARDVGDIEEKRRRYVKSCVPEKVERQHVVSPDDSKEHLKQMAEYWARKKDEGLDSSEAHLLWASEEEESVLQKASKYEEIEEAGSERRSVEKGKDCNQMEKLK